MAHITIEYMIMIPVLIMQIFLFLMLPQLSWILTDDSLYSMELQTTAGHMSSSIQQLYYTMNHGSFSNGSMKVNLDVPPINPRARIHDYSKSCNLILILPSQLMNVTLKIIGDYRTSFNFGHVGDKRKLARKLGIQQHRTFT